MKYIAKMTSISDDTEWLTVAVRSFSINLLWNCHTNLAGIPKTSFKADVAGNNLVDVRVWAVSDLSFSGSKLTFHFKAAQTNEQGTCDKTHGQWKQVKSYCFKYSDILCFKRDHIYYTTFKSKFVQPIVFVVFGWRF